MNIGYLWNEVGKLGSFGENSLEEEDTAWDIPGLNLQNSASFHFGIFGRVRFRELRRAVLFSRAVYFAKKESPDKVEFMAD